MGTRAVKALPEARVAKLEREARAAPIAPLGLVALRVVLVKVQGVALALVARMPDPRVRVGPVKKGVPMRDRLEAPLQANRLTRTVNPLCGQRVGHVGHAPRVVRALVRVLVRVLQLVARALRRGAVGPASQLLDVHRQVLVTATQTAQASHAQHRAAMIGSPKGRRRTSRACPSQNRREAIARQNLGESQAGTRHHFAANESLLRGSLNARSAIAGQAFYREPCVNRWYSKTFLLNSC